LVKLERKESKTHTIETDGDVTAFIDAWKVNNNNG
jgi:hypothetical protein